MNSLKGHRFVFPEKEMVLLEAFEPGLPEKNQVLVRTEYSLMSTGTEGICFGRLFAPGTHWDGWVKYPFYPGYTSVGVVEAVGSEVSKIKAGEFVAFRTPHRSHALVAEAGCYPIPEGLPLEKALWFSLAKIAFHGALAANYALGDRVLIIGAGPIGQMSVRWALAAGARTILVVDGVELRLNMARVAASVVPIALPISEARSAILEANSGELPGVVLDTTGNASVFSSALGIAADRGTVVILGDTGSPSEQCLTSDVIARGLTIVGAHDAHNTSKWSGPSIIPMFFEYVLNGRFSLEGLNTHFFKPEECLKAYHTAARNRESTMGIIFDWRNS